MDFYPRPPRGGRPTAGGLDLLGQGFLSTPSARRATTRTAAGTANTRNFYPRPPRGGRRSSPIKFHAHRGFLSTPSARRATKVRVQRVRMDRFLSTPSARRATAILQEKRRIMQISIHALREEGDDHANRCLHPCADFYPRPPRGGRREIVKAKMTLTMISIHALREEGDDHANRCLHPCADFYPRPPRGGRLRPRVCARTRLIFLSTPSARRATTGILSEKTTETEFLSTPSARRATRICC